MNNTISSNIPSVGTKFIVTDKTADGTFGPGTAGLMSYVEGADVKYANVVYINVIILRRGKHGMLRLDTALISTPVFNFKNMNSITIMPNKEQKHYIYIKQKTFTPYTIYDMTDLEYLGWGLSWINYLEQLSQNTNSFFIWPTKEKSIIKKMSHISALWRDDPQYIYNRFCSNEARKIFVEQMRILESTLFECSLSYMLRVAKLETRAINYLILNNKDKTKVGSKKMLNEVHNTYITKYTNLKLLANKKIIPLKKDVTFPF